MNRRAFLSLPALSALRTKPTRECRVEGDWDTYQQILVRVPDPTGSDHRLLAHTGQALQPLKDGDLVEAVVIDGATWWRKI